MEAEKEPRVSLILAVKVECLGRDYRGECTTRDISPVGAFLRGASLPSMGERLRLEILLNQGQSPIMVDAVVVGMERGGVDVRFEFLSVGNRRALERRIYSTWDRSDFWEGLLRAAGHGEINLPQLMKLTSMVHQLERRKGFAQGQ